MQSQSNNFGRIFFLVLSLFFSVFCGAIALQFLPKAPILLVIAFCALIWRITLKAIIEFGSLSNWLDGSQPASPEVEWKPGRTLLLTFLSLSMVYLSLEAIFNTYLVDQLGTLSANDDDKIHDLESRGRALTGVALALFFVRSPLRFISSGTRREWSWPGKIALITFLYATISIVSFATAYYGIDYIVESIAEKTSGAYRRNAMISSFIVQQFHLQKDGNAVLKLNNRSVDSYIKNTEGRFVLAALPFMLSHVPDLASRAEDFVRETIQEDLRRPSADCQTIGPLDQAYECWYGKLYDKWFIPAFNDVYAPAAETFDVARLKADKFAEQKWTEYVERLEKQHLTPEGALANRFYDRVVKQVRADIPEIPHLWSPNDKKTFVDVVKEKTLREANAGYRNALLAVGITERIEPGSARKPLEFVKLPAVQGAWRAKAVEYNLPYEVGAFGPRIGDDRAIKRAFAMEVYQKALQRAFDEGWKPFNGEMVSYLSGGQYERQSFKVTKATVVVPIALTASLVGILAHIGKCSFLLSGLIKRTWLPPKIVSIVVILTILLLVLQMPYPTILSDQLVKRTLNDMGASLAVPTVRTWAFFTNLEKCVYPIGQRIMRTGKVEEVCW
jgi:hypothetical protein